MPVGIIECTDPLELFRHYDGQFETQGAYIELDLREGKLLANYDSEVGGNAQPFSVFYGFDRRYTIPVLTGDAANRMMQQVAPLADRILADWEEKWDGNSMIAVLGEDAEAAEAEIESLLGSDEEDYDDSDLVQEWDIDGVINGSEADEYDITADTTDARLTEIESEILGDLAEVGPSGVVVCPGLEGYLRGLRDELAEEDPLTDAELRTARETLGLTGDHFAKLLRVNPRTVRSWEQGRDAVPGRIRPEVAELREQTDKAVTDLVAAYEAGDDDTVITYRSDDEYVAANPHGRWSASWHRQVAARAAAQAGAHIAYADEE